MARIDSPKPHIVAATGASANAHMSGNWASAARQEQAMADAIKKATDEGITDPVEIKARMMRAREEVLDITSSE
jgi:hypothetical protein